MFAGLERIAEELMGRRKWHQYQDILAKNYLLEEELMERREWVPVKTCNSCDVNTDLSVADHSPAELVNIHIKCTKSDVYRVPAVFYLTRFGVK